MKYFRFVFKSVFRKKSRAFLTIASIVLVLVLIVVLQSLLRAMDYDDSGRGASRIVVQHATGLANFMPVAYRQRIEQIPGVVAVAPEIWFGGTYIDQRPQNFFGQLSTDPRAWAVINDDYEISAEQLAAWQGARDSFIAGQQLLDRYGWKIGDRIALQGTYIQADLDLVLAGVYRAKDESNIFFHNEYLANSRATWIRDSAGVFFLRTADPGAVPRVTAAINGLFENSEAPVKAMPEKQFQLQFVEMLGNIKLLVRSIAAIVLFTVVLIVANTMAMSARERVGQIAVIRALGFRRGQVLGLVLSEALLLAVLGGIAGVLLAIPFTALVVAGMKETPVAMFAYNVRLAPAVVATAFGASVLIGFLAGFVPAWRSSRVSIVDGLRRVV